MLGILGFSSCSKQDPETLDTPSVTDPGAFMAAYGVPTARYKVSGKVFTDTGKPIQGIKVDVSFSRDWYRDFDGKSTILYTSADGSFSSEFRYYPQKDVTISFTDIDGGGNQGFFQTKTLSVSAIQVEKGEGWFQGTYSVSATVKLDKK